AVPPADSDALLLTADRFVNRSPELGLTSLEREALLRRLGLYGIRLAVSLLRHQVAGTATDLAAKLAERSGIGTLRELLASLFFERRDVLKSRTALRALTALARAHPRPGSDAVAAEVERIIASAHPFQELRVLSSLRADALDGKPEHLAELERLIGGSGTAPHLRLDLPAGTDPATLAAAANDALVRWQRRAEHPLTAHELASAARVAVRSCEGMVATLSRA